MRRYQIVVRITTHLMAVRMTLLLSQNPSFINLATDFNDSSCILKTHSIRVFSVMVISLIMVIKMTALMVVNFTVLKALFLQNLKSTTSHWILVIFTFLHRDGNLHGCLCDSLFVETSSQHPVNGMCWLKMHVKVLTTRSTSKMLATFIPCLINSLEIWQ